jgi:exosortase
MPGWGSVLTLLAPAIEPLLDAKPWESVKSVTVAGRHFCPMQKRKSNLHPSGTKTVKRVSWAWLQHSWPALLGLVAVTFPTWRFITTESWSTEQGSHGPLVLASGLWLLVKMLPETTSVRRRPPAWRAYGAIVAMVAALILFRTAAVIELEVYALYGLFAAVLYSYIGARALQILWFPLFYLLFAVPLPDSLVAALTNPLKMWISQSAVSLLYFLSYPIASAGVMIQIGQYQLLVAAACAGLNSLITLTALTLFYVYLSHRANWRYMVLLIAAAVPVAIFSNMVRVLLLILITYHSGEAAAQGFLHNFAGMTTFAISLATIYLLDLAVQKSFGWTQKRRAKV